MSWNDQGPEWACMEPDDEAGPSDGPAGGARAQRPSMKALASLLGQEVPPAVVWDGIEAKLRQEGVIR